MKLFNALFVDVHNTLENIEPVKELTSGLVEWKVVNSVEGAQEVMTSCDESLDLVFLDCLCPNSNTKEICESIRNSPNCQFASIVYYSSEDSLEKRLLAYETGADDFIDKTISNEELLSKLNVCINYQNNRRLLVEGFQKETQGVLELQFGEQADMTALISLYKDCLTIKDVDSLGGALKLALSEFQLEYSLHITTEVGDFYAKNDGLEFSPMELKLFESLSLNEFKVQSFGKKTYFNYGDVELIIHNMPETRNQLRLK